MTATASGIKELRTKNVKPVPTICPFCGAGCGLLVYAKEGAPKDGPQNTQCSRRSRQSN